MRPILLTRLANSQNWTTQSPSSPFIGSENERRIRAEGGEAYNLSAEAVNAFFAIVPEARDLVRTSILSHQTLLTTARKRTRISAIGFLVFALMLLAMTAHLKAFESAHGFAAYFYPDILIEGVFIFCAFLLSESLFRLSSGFGELLERAHSRSPFLRSLRTQD